MAEEKSTFLRTLGNVGRVLGKTLQDKLKEDGKGIWQNTGREIAESAKLRGLLKAYNKDVKAAQAGMRAAERTIREAAEGGNYVVEIRTLSNKTAYATSYPLGEDPEDRIVELVERKRNTGQSQPAETGFFIHPKTGTVLMYR